MIDKLGVQALQDRLDPVDATAPSPAYAPRPCKRARCTRRARSLHLERHAIETRTAQCRQLAVRPLRHWTRLRFQSGRTSSGIVCRVRFGKQFGFPQSCAESCVFEVRAKLPCSRLNFSSFPLSKPMSKLTALKRQIAALEAQAERIAKEEMGSAIAKVKGIMAEFNLTIEHLTQTVSGKRVAKKAKAKIASVAKYADPKTGKTWSGFGRAPGWIAGAKHREAFLVGKAAAPEVAAKAPAAPKKAAAKATKAVKVAKKDPKPVAKKASTPAKKALKAKVASVAAKKAPSAKKPSAKKSAPKSARSKQAVRARGDSAAAPTA